LRLFSFGGYGLALAALALVVFGAYDTYPVRLVLRLRPLALATFLVWRLRIGACGVGACGFWRLLQLPELSTLALVSAIIRRAQEIVQPAGGALAAGPGRAGRRGPRAGGAGAPAGGRRGGRALPGRAAAGARAGARARVGRQEPIAASAAVGAARGRGLGQAEVRPQSRPGRPRRGPARRGAPLDGRLRGPHDPHQGPCRGHGRAGPQEDGGQAGGGRQDHSASARTSKACWI